MKKVKKTLPMKGVRIPRLLLFLLGFIHGRLHTAQLEGGVIASAFLVGQIERFYMACTVRCMEAARTLYDEWKNADKLLLELELLLLEFPEAKAAESNTSTQARAKEKAQVKRHTILTELSRIANTIRAETERADKQMEATAHLLMSCFTAYGHGVLMKPISSKNLPEILYKKYTDVILEAHKSTWSKLNSVLKEEI